MKCSQTDCLSLEKEHKNANHGEKWFLRKKMGNDYSEEAKFQKKIRIVQKYFRFG